MQRADARAAPRHDLHLEIHEAPQRLGVLVVDELMARRAKKALPLGLGRDGAEHARYASGFARALSSGSCHDDGYL